MIIASLATIKGREKQRAITVGSLYQQCDYVRVHAAPLECGREDDARKFHLPMPDDMPAYILTCDDDFRYAPNYAEWMVQVLAERTAEYGPCVISLMGRTLRPPLASYYRDGQNYTKYDWRDPTAREGPVHLPGTGVMCYHTDTIRFTMDDFPEQNCADIMVGIKCNALNIPIIRVSPPCKNWLELLEVDNTIWERYVNDDAVQTKLINDTSWHKIETG